MERPIPSRQHLKIGTKGALICVLKDDEPIVSSYTRDSLYISDLSKTKRKIYGRKK